MNTQTNFANALLDIDVACPTGLSTWNGSDPSSRFAVYRNNVMVSLIDALADTYPIVLTLVGEDFFRAMARTFAARHPPRSAVMAYYGRDFAGFIGEFPPAASVPYLADMARLEMARVEAYHAADVAAIQAHVLQAALAVSDQLLSLQLDLHPSVRLVESEYSIVSIWNAHQSAENEFVLDPDIAQTALVYRENLDVFAVEVTAGTGTFVSTLLNGQTLADAALGACSIDPDFDLSSALALLLRLQLIIHLKTREVHHDHTH